MVVTVVIIVPHSSIPYYVTKGKLRDGRGRLRGLNSYS